jgi:adenosylmethionine-8-amino-7-oxononanoate aminotransferase
MSQSSLLQADKIHIWHPFTQAKTAADAIVIIRGQAASLFDEQGKEYLDLISSWWVNLHGHSHPKIVEAIVKQAQTLDHVMFAGFTHAPAVTLAQKLTALLPASLQRVFYSDNGSTAIEVAVKMSLQYWYNQGIKKKRIIAFEGAYHGDTFGAMSLGQSSGFYHPFADYLFDVDFVTYPQTWDDDAQVIAKEAKSLAELDELIQQKASEIAALIIEPLVQGAAGMRFCRPAFLEAVVSRCKASNILVIFDEVMTGFGRTGTLFACDQQQQVPDIICLSKGITGGFLPLAVTVTTENIYQNFLDCTFEKAFTHGHSYTAHPLGCAAAIASLTVFEEEKTFDKIKIIQEIHKGRIAQLAKTGKIQHGRVQGTIAAMDVKIDSTYASSMSQQLRQAFLGAGLNLRPLGNVVYLMPPYCITPEQLHQAYDKIEQILHQS